MPRTENARRARAGSLVTDRPPRETADDYPDIVARLSDRWRVILCPAGIQWILQRRDGERAGGTRWAGVGYCTTREALLRLCRGLESPVDPAALLILAALPQHIKTEAAVVTGRAMADG
jgi:hypothetical protein